MELHLYSPLCPQALKRDNVSLNSDNTTCQARACAGSSNITSVAHSLTVVFSYSDTSANEDNSFRNHIR